MYKSKIVIALIIVICVFFFVSQFLNNQFLSRYLQSLIVPLFTLLYFINIENKKIFFSLFLICYAISDLMTLVKFNMSSLMYYYVGNSLYILAYVFLILEICKTMSLVHLLRYYKLHIIVLIGLNIYVVYVLEPIVNPSATDFANYINYYFIETLYNIIILMLLSVSLMNYFYMDNKKSLFLFIASLCILFGEIMNIAYLFVAKTNILNAIVSFFGILAFIFYYQQSKLENEKASGIITK